MNHTAEQSATQPQPQAIKPTYENAANLKNQSSEHTDMARKPNSDNVFSHGTMPAASATAVPAYEPENPYAASAPAPSPKSRTGKVDSVKVVHGKWGKNAAETSKKTQTLAGNMWQHCSDPVTTTPNGKPKNKDNYPSEKIIQVVSIDNHEFWFMAFLHHENAIKSLQAAILPRNLSRVVR